MPDTQIDRPFVAHWANLYTADQSAAEQEAESLLFETVGPAVRERGFYGAAEFAAVVAWKNPRGKGYASRNDEEDIEEVTRIALGASAHLRLGILGLLSGVGTPVASALLTVWNPQQYTVVDWRAVESLRSAGQLPAGSGAPGYARYLGVCTALAADLEVELRDLDRALWKYSQKVLSPDRRGS